MSTARDLIRQVVEGESPRDALREAKHKPNPFPKMGQWMLKKSKGLYTYGNDYSSPGGEYGDEMAISVDMGTLDVANAVAGKPFEFAWRVVAHNGKYWAGLNADGYEKSTLADFVKKVSGVEKRMMKKFKMKQSTSTKFRKGMPGRPA